MKPLLSLIVLALLLTSAGAQEWAGSQVIFLGESHLSQRDHEGQLQALQFLSQRSNRLVLAAEMFHEAGQETLRARSTHPEYQDPGEDFWKSQWGHPYALYRPIFRWAHWRGVPIEALRPDPTRVKELKSRGPAAVIGLLDTFTVGPRAYQDSLKAIVDSHMPEGDSAPQVMVDQFFLVQCFWDEYMAWRVAQLADLYPDSQIVVMVGHGHLHPDYGIPWRLARRRPDLKWASLAFETEADWQPTTIFPPPDEWPQSDEKGDFLTCHGPVLGPVKQPLTPGSLWRVTSDGLDCRREPRADSPLIATLTKGSQLQADVGRGGSDEVWQNAVDSEGDYWMRVRDAEGRPLDGYVRANIRFLEPLVSN